MNDAPRSGGRGETRTLAALPPLPADADLSRYLAFAEVLRRVPISDKTLLAKARDPEDPCPPVYELGPKKRVMEAAAAEAWIRSQELPAADTEMRDGQG